MKKAKLLCKTDATAILKFFYFADGSFAFFYEVRKNGLLRYYVNVAGKVYGPYDGLSMFYDKDIQGDEGKSAKGFGWEAEIGGKKFVFMNGKSLGEKKPFDFKKECKELDKLWAASLAKMEKYDEKTHVLRNDEGTPSFFVTEKKKYGPYDLVLKGAYKDERHFQFLYRKKKSDETIYYNLNGKDVAEFVCGRSAHLFARAFYDSKGRAILDSIPERYILIDGKKTVFFDGSAIGIKYADKKEFGYELISGKDCFYDFSEVIYNGNRISRAKDWIALKNGSIAYVRHGDGGRNDAWFVKNAKSEKQISVWFDGERSEIVGSAIRYERGGVPYLMIEGREWNGFVLNPDAMGEVQGVSFKKSGFVFLKNSGVYFYECDTPNKWFVSKDNMASEENDRLIDENIMSLASGSLLAGDISLP